MCVLRGRGARERPWRNTGWVVVLSIHVLTDPIGSPCADPVLSLDSSMRNGPETFRNIPRNLPRKLPQDSDMRNVPGTFRNIPGTFLEHSSKADEDSGMQNVLGTFRNIPRTYRIGRTHPVLHLCSLSFRTDPIPSVMLFYFFFHFRFFSCLLFSFYGIGHTRQTAPHPVRSVKLSCLGPG